MSNAKHTSKTPAARTATAQTATNKGIFATLARLLRGRGSGAPARRLAALLAAAVLLLLAAAPQAFAAYGLSEFDVSFEDEGGAAQLQAGAHPFAFTTSLEVNNSYRPEELEADNLPDGDIKDLTVTQIPGLVANPTATPRCSAASFAEVGHDTSACPISSAIGTAHTRLSGPQESNDPVFNLIPPPGYVLALGFWAVEAVPVTLLVRLSPNPPYNGIVELRNVVQIIPVLSSRVSVWGVPADPRHDPERGVCWASDKEDSCPTDAAAVPFLTSPRACHGPLGTGYETDSWQAPGAWLSGSALTHDEIGPQGFAGCGRLGFQPTIDARPSAAAASSPSGLDFSLDTNDEESFANPNEGALADSDIEKAVVTLPEGMSANPSIAEGLGVCTEADLEAETAFSAPGEGCPNASKIGTVEVETPLLPDKLLKGSLYVAKPYENEFNSLLALYIVIKDPELGIVVRQAARVEPDPVTGQLTTVTEEMPQLPFSHFRLHFREGTRSPLVTPPACGSYDVAAKLYPYSGNAPVSTTSAFEVISGPDNAPCPSGGLPPFHPELTAGTLNNAAGRYSPFNLRLSRSDSEQEITHFSIKLPPGITGKLAGIPYCPDAAIAAAKARTGPHGGQEELDSPSCPAASQIGRTLAGAGVGPALTYAPGKVYLSGPYHGSPLSMVAITAGVVGPFDIGTIVVREAFQINPETAEVFIDATGSDPIPHIIAGIPVHLRDIRAYVDKPNFVLNPTSCARTSTASTVLGSGLDFASEADDNPITVSSPFQAADCASLPFKPKLALKLTGATKRGANPALRATLIPRAGDANSKSISVQLPHSEFLDQAHIRTVCTRVQFNAGAGNGAGCPAGSVYGHARAWTPLLSEPLEGPVFLRSSEHPLPDLVLAMHGLIDFNAIGRVDSVDGGIRNSFDFVPDAPVSKVVVDLEGGAKGLLENSTNLCKSKNRAIAKFQGHNGKAFNANPLLQVKCKQHKKHKQAKGHKRHARAAR